MNRDLTEWDRCPKPTVTPTFCPQKFDTIISNPQNTPKWHFLGVGIGFGKWTYVKLSVIFHSKSLCTNTILVKRSVNYCHPYMFRGCSYRTSKNYKIIFQNYSRDRLKENMGYGHVPPHFCHFEKVEQLPNSWGVLS